jgi:phage terminase large subunit GpA-like protein
MKMGAREVYGREYFESLTAEHRVEDHWVLKREGMRNEKLDCRVYSIAAKEILGVDAQRLKELADELRRRAPSTTSAKPAPRRRVRKLAGAR